MCTDKTPFKEAPLTFTGKKTMLIRIPLTSDNSVITELYPDSSGGDTGPSPAVLPPLNINLQPAPLSELGSNKFGSYPYPCAAINVNLPSDDRDLVSGWLGASAPSSALPSDTLVRRMTTAVTETLNNYFENMALKGLFTRPFKLAYVLMRKDGYTGLKSVPAGVYPAQMAPQLALREYVMRDSSLQTVTEIFNTPVRIQLEIPSLSEYLDDDVAGIALIATRQCDLLTGDETVSAIRYADIYGEHLPVWHYNRLAADLIRDKVEGDGLFRVLAVIDKEDLQGGEYSLTLPLAASYLTDWDSLPKFEGEVASDEERQPERVRLVTRPLDLGLPEQYKKVKGVTLRGIFPRADEEESTLFSLYGSLHRDRWHLVARTRGAHIRLLRKTAWRWYRVEIDAPHPAQFDAITFLM